MPLISRRAITATALVALRSGLRGATPTRLAVSPKAGPYRTVQQAIDAVRFEKGGDRPHEIHVPPGTYHERITVPRDRPFIRLVGEDAQRTILTYNLSAATTAETRYSASTYIFADDFQAENVTFENTYGVGSQAVAIFIGADRAVFRHCRFLGWQDTLYVNGPGCHFVPQPLAATEASNCPAGRQFFDQCYIEGHVDFVFGNAAALFRQCQIHSKGPGYVTAQSRTYPAQTSGFVFESCRLTGENTGSGVYLGRPWRAYSQVVFRNCALGAHIRPEGWSAWNGNRNHETAYYAEYQSQGPGARSDGRVPWSHQLTPQEAARFAPRTFLRGEDGWEPVA